MYFGYEGNSKIGEDAIAHSRPVGAENDGTCPSTCKLLDGECYAQAQQTRWPNTLAAAKQNLITEANQMHSMFVRALKSNQDVRLFVTGDAMRNNKLDKEFLANLRWAAESVRAKHGRLPKIWLFTHVHRKELAALSDIAAVYASVHTEGELAKAEKAGFTLFALADLDGSLLPIAPKTTSKKKKDAWRATLPARIKFGGKEFLVCPEQRKGRDRVTCSGGIKTMRCGWCVEGRGSVAFALH
jgi:hypothetical protein